MDSSRIFVDPSYSKFLRGGLFDVSNAELNRDDQLLPFHRLRVRMRAMGVDIHTADALDAMGGKTTLPKYISLGIMDRYESLMQARAAELTAFVVMEPPVVAPDIYAALPKLTAAFKNVYVHNVRGDGYSLDGVDQSRLRRFYWPIPYNDILENYWSRVRRDRRLVVINSAHRAPRMVREQYSARIAAMAALAPMGCIDLFGKGWEMWWARRNFWLPYWLNRRSLMRIFKGACTSKFEVLSRYEFCLCFENMSMDGYITEKIFDCLYAGTIPIYMGAPDITGYVPQSVFIDAKGYPSWKDLWSDLSSMPTKSLEGMREAGREFLKGDKALAFYQSMEDVFSA